MSDYWTLISSGLFSGINLFINLAAVNVMSIKDHCQRFSPLQISDASQAELEPAQNPEFRICLIK